MKVKNGFVLREIVGTLVVVPTGSRVVEFNGLVSLSESGAFLWKKLEVGSDFNGLVKAMMSEYLVDEETAKTDVKEFLATLSDKDLLEE